MITLLAEVLLVHFEKLLEGLMSYGTPIILWIDQPHFRQNGAHVLPFVNVLSVLAGPLYLHGAALELSDRRSWMFDHRVVFISFIEHNNYNYRHNRHKNIGQSSSTLMPKKKAKEAVTKMRRQNNFS